MLKYDLNYIKAKIKELDEFTMMNGLDLKIEISGRMQRTKGCFTYKINRITGDITPVGFKFSKSILDGRYSEEVVIGVIKHEYAHYLANVCNNMKCGHGPLWKQACEYIGCKSEQYFNEEVEDETVIPKKKVYVITCENCGTETIKHRKSNLITNLHQYRCGCCHGKLKVSEEMRRV